MELMYICLSLGYKGQYCHPSDHDPLEQITDQLYKHIRVYRGSFSKILSPMLSKPASNTTPDKTHSLILIFFVTACMIMTIFVSLGYLTDIISNGAYTKIAKMEKSTTHKTIPA
jgi:type VI secretion system protein ImpK